MATIKEAENKKYYSVGAEGTFRLKVEQDTPNAKHREWEVDGKKGECWELHYQEIQNGYIRSIEVLDTDYGQNLLIQVDDLPLVSLGTSNNYGTSFMKILPNVDLTKPVDLRPYSFENEKGKTVKGVSVKQDGEKLTNFFYDMEKKENVNDFPTPEGDTAKFTKDDWKIYFLGVKKFLVEYTKENIIPNIPELSVEEVNTKKEEEIPFE